MLHKDCYQTQIQYVLSNKGYSEYIIICWRSELSKLSAEWCNRFKHGFHDAWRNTTFQYYFEYQAKLVIIDSVISLHRTE